MSKIPKLRILSILAVAAALAALIAVPVLAQPPVTSPLSGSVTIDGSNAPVGTTVAVFVGTETTARATVTTTTAGYYELVVLGGSADVGKVLSFKVNTLAATSSPASPTFLSYQPQVVNLSVTTGPTYTLTVSVSPAGKGSVTKNPNLAQYPAGTVVTLTAYATAGWDFDKWIGTNNNNINPTTVTMNANKSVTAYFEEEEGPSPESFAWWLYETFVECLVD
jgi:hypothetical protein